MVLQRLASAKFSSTIPAAMLGQLNDHFKRIADCSMPDEFRALAEEMKVSAPSYHEYMFDSGYPPSTWADRGGRPFTNFHIKNNNPAGV